MGHGGSREGSRIKGSHQRTDDKGQGVEFTETWTLVRRSRNLDRLSWTVGRPDGNELFHFIWVVCFVVFI